MIVSRPFRTSRRNASSPRAAAMKARVPRVARLMALAVHFDQLIRDRVVDDQAELARLGQVTRARLTQIMDLINLAPDIQEQLLQLRIEGTHALTERRLRPIAAIAEWRRQRDAWTETLSELSWPARRDRI